MSIQLSSLIVNRPLPNYFGNKAVILGDSLSAGYKKATTYGAYLSGMSIVKNLAIGGATSTQMLATYIANESTLDYNTLIVQCGTNDLGVGISAQTTLENLESLRLLVCAKSADMVVVLLPVRSDAIENSHRLRFIQNQWCRKNGVICIDPFAVGIDSATGSWKSGWSTDGIHPIGIKHPEIGLEFYRLNPLKGFGNSFLYPKYKTNCGGKFSDPINITDTNADGLADGWSVVAPLSPSLVSDASFSGNAQKFTLADGALSEYYAYKSTTNLIAGNKYAVSARVKNNSASETYAVSLFLCTNFTANTGIQYLFENAAGIFDLSASILFTPISSSTNIYMKVQVNKLGASNISNAAVMVGEMQIWDLTSLGLV